MKTRPILRALLAALLVCILLCSAASAEIHVGEEKPADWDQRDLLKITFFEEVTDEAILIVDNHLADAVDICRILRRGRRTWISDEDFRLRLNGWHP